MGSVVASFDSKTDLQRKAHGRGYKSDMEAFMELEKIKEMEEHIKQQMIWAGRPGMWDDWLQFQKQAKEERDRREAEERARKEEMKQLILYTFYAVCGLIVFVPTLFLILTILK